MILEHSCRETVPPVSMVYVEMLRPDPDQRNGRRLAKLYREHATAAFSYAHHLTGSREDAEDLVQLAFLEVHRALARGERIVNPRAWLVTAVKHRAYNLHRDRHETPESDAIERLADRPTDDAADTAGDLERVRAVLYGLPEAQHHAFVLRHWSGMSNADIAGVLDCSESAVESLLVRARQAIVSDDTLSDACLDVRRRLSQGGAVGRFHHRHLDGCRSCRTAQQRLARIAGIAAAVVLVPRIHVAQALAASAPGFSVAAATGGTGAGVAAAGAGAKLGAAKTALAILSVGAVAAGAGAAHTHLSLHAHHGGPTTRQAGLLPATSRSSPLDGGRTSPPGAASDQTAGTSNGRDDARQGNDSTPTGEDTGSDSSGSSTDQSSPTDQAPTDGGGSEDGSTSADPALEQGQDGSGSRTDTTPQPDTTSGDQSTG